ncbi:Uncharacterised protein [Neisseria animaloris]|uniref:hypothetical protein n=1 Tax=Neisseria animaloris TaxID=326522 RepID=UPI000A18F8A7|nr:hypothetical protein [Neisseria animaloris]OSI08223.1 hypothetical protein BWD08_03085 [Neisseria animaloris]VEH86601.1 Uncharacterised protein [Neisseria animaloris]
MEQDLRELLLQLYLINNPKAEHKVFIYTYQGVSDMAVNPFQYAEADLIENVKKSVILQNLPSGEMVQAFVVPSHTSHKKQIWEIENIMLYGNKSGVLVPIELDKENIGQSDKYRQFVNLTDSMLRQFIQE